MVSQPHLHSFKIENYMQITRNYANSCYFPPSQNEMVRDTFTCCCQYVVTPRHIIDPRARFTQWFTINGWTWHLIIPNGKVDCFTGMGYGGGGPLLQREW